MTALLFRHSYRNPLYNTWREMRRRCQNPCRKDYKWYGGKGIQVCTRWENFQLFAADMADSWFPGATIERLDNNKDYTKNNCTWLTLSQQQRHRTPRRSCQ